MSCGGGLISSPPDLERRKGDMHKKRGDSLVVLVLLLSFVSGGGEGATIQVRTKDAAAPAAMLMRRRLLGCSPDSTRLG